jgi:Na+(H+)/acetate symporter ActP
MNIIILLVLIVICPFIVGYIQKELSKTNDVRKAEWVFLIVGCIPLFLGAMSANFNLMMCCLFAFVPISGLTGAELGSNNKWGGSEEKGRYIGSFVGILLFFILIFMFNRNNDNDSQNS